MTRGTAFSRRAALSAGAAGFVALVAPNAGHAVEPATSAAAPEFTGIDAWLNTPPLTMAALRGRPVLVNFWTHSCINCQRTLPILSGWHDGHGPQGLAVVGVHSPEFGFERRRDSVARAVERQGLRYAVALDGRHLTWRAYGNRFWPAFYLVDRRGRIVDRQFGEDGMAPTDRAIRRLLGTDLPLVEAVMPAGDAPQSPEMYLGRRRVAHLANPALRAAGAVDHALPSTLPPDSFALGGAWSIGEETATLVRGPGVLRVHARARRIHVVAGSRAPMDVNLALDGTPRPAVTIDETLLYTLIDDAAAGWHVLVIAIPAAGLEAYALTFG